MSGPSYLQNKCITNPTPKAHAFHSQLSLANWGFITLYPIRVPYTSTSTTVIIRLYDGEMVERNIILISGEVTHVIHACKTNLGHLSSQMSM